MSLWKLLLALVGIEVRQGAKKAAKGALDAVDALIQPDEEPFPLTHKQVRHQQEQIAKATAHGSGMHRIERETLIPPKP